MDNVEIWKDVPHYEGLYQVSNLGNVWTVRKNRLMRPGFDGYGYLRVCLTNQYGKRRTETVHRLVALAFLEKPENCTVVNHKDENKLNNCVDNLEWLTIQDNLNYGTARKRQAQKMMGHKVSPETRKKISEGMLNYWKQCKEDNDVRQN